MADMHIPVPPLDYNNTPGHKPPRRKRPGRILRGYLMTVGALTTIAALVWLVVWVLVQIETWVH